MRATVERATLCCIVAAAVVAVPVAAQGRAPAPGAPGACPHAQAYPPRPAAIVRVSSNRPAVGAKITVSGTDYCPDERVSITLGGQQVATAHTDGTGSFDPALTVPGPAGRTRLCGIGASGLADDRDCLTLFVHELGGTAASATPVAGDAGGTAFTGVEIAALIAAGAVLSAAGVAFATAGRRRKPVSV